MKTDSLPVKHSYAFKKNDKVSWYSRRWKAFRFGTIVDIREHSTKRHPNTARVIISPLSRRHVMETNPAVILYKNNMWPITSLNLQ